MEYQFKTLIVGGGPSGTSCGISLLNLGHDCCIVDRHTFPRVKLCAGLFTGKSQECLRSVLGDMAYAEIIRKSLMSREREFSLWKGKTSLVTCDLMDDACIPRSLRSTDCRIMLVDRPVLDESLIRHFVSLGGVVIEGDAVMDVDFGSKVVRLSSGDTVRYENIVAADGALSLVERKLCAFDKSFVGKGKSSLCLEINVDRKDLDINGANIYFDVVRGSYAWAFSKGEKVCVGLVKLPWERDVDIKDVMRRFCDGIGLKNQDKYKVQGAMLPFGNFMATPAWRDSVYFVGDAAGLVEPLTGEGIYYALQSGKYAAESIMSGGTDVYINKVLYLHSLIKKGRFYQSLLEMSLPLRFFFRHAPRNKHFISYFYLTQIEHACLDPFWKIIMRYKRQK